MLLNDVWVSLRSCDIDVIYEHMKHSSEPQNIYQVNFRSAVFPFSLYWMWNMLRNCLLDTASYHWSSFRYFVLCVMAENAAGRAAVHGRQFGSVSLSGGRRAALRHSSGRHPRLRVRFKRPAVIQRGNNPGTREQMYLLCILILEAPDGRVFNVSRWVFYRSFSPTLLMKKRERQKWSSTT